MQYTRQGNQVKDEKLKSAGTEKSKETRAERADRIFQETMFKKFSERNGEYVAVRDWSNVIGLNVWYGMFLAEWPDTQTNEATDRPAYEMTRDGLEVWQPTYMSLA